METFVLKTEEQMGGAAADAAAETITRAIEQKGCANIILATGTSQFETLEALTARRDIDWPAVTMFHLDEYVGLGPDHPAGFRRYLKERFVDKVGKLKAVHFINGDAPDPDAECKRLGKIIAAHPIDTALAGIGENGHLAFNDPPADFRTDESFIVVNLDERCRRQQMAEGWFETLQHVPAHAISMSIRQIMKSRSIIVSVPQARKADAVKRSLEGQISNMCPASILKEHPHCKVFMDEAGASLLSKKNTKEV